MNYQCKSVWIGNIRHYRKNKNVWVICLLAKEYAVYHCQGIGQGIPGMYTYICTVYTDKQNFKYNWNIYKSNVIT